MAENKKKELIQKTYEILKDVGPEDTKIRTIASKANCTSTVIYRHFNDLDHLLLFASISSWRIYGRSAEDIQLQYERPGHGSTDVGVFF